MDWELYIFFLNQSYGGFKKLVFRLHEFLLNLAQSWLSDNERILDQFEGPRKKADAAFLNQF